jgi:class 3 adenylate cyclase
VISCPSCGALNKQDARFCASCGASLGAACANCGAALPSGAKFCPACGTSIVATSKGEERKLVTALFADVVGFTGLGERLDAERLKEVMDAYFGAMREEIEAEGGTVEKFIGDAVMAVFGVPIAHEDDPARALRAALRMRARLERLNQELERSHGLALEMRIGVNSGEVLAVTEPRPGEAMVAGDAVNVAARLQQTGEPGDVLVAERVARATRGFRFEEVAPLSLKGKGVPVRALRLLGEGARPESGIAGLRAPLVGRDAEMTLLDSLYDRVTQERRPNLITVFGDPGVGKSRLVAEFLQRAERRDEPPLLLSGRCLPYGDGVTYWPLAEILKGLAGVLDSDPSDLAVEKIRKLGRELLTPDVTPDPARATAALAYTVGVEDPEVSLRDLAPRQVRIETHGAWRSLFSALATERTVVLTIEDIHWADAAMLDLLEEVADRAQGPLFILCPARPELTHRRPGWGGGRRNYSSISLDPLTMIEAEQLVGTFLDAGDLPSKLRSQILERAEGNPFFLEEILRHLIDEGHLVREGDRCHAGTDATEVILPDTVQGVLAARIDLLTLEEKHVLQAAAVVGRVFWAGVVRKLLDNADLDVEQILDRLEDRELVRARLVSSIGEDHEYIFKHVLTREVGYESIPRRERARAHALAAGWLEETTRGREREFAELLAHHFVEAHRALEQDARADAAYVDALRTKAFEYLLMASAETVAKLVIAKSQQLAELALSLARAPLERSRALVALGLAHKTGYEGDRAWAFLREGVDELIAGAPDDHAAIVALCALALDVPTRWPGSMRTLPSESEAARYLHLGMEHAESLPPGDSEELARLLTIKAFWPYGFPGAVDSDEELEAAQKEGERAAAIGRRLGRPDLESAGLDGASASVIARDWYGHIDPLINRRLELAAVIHDPWELGDIFGMAAWSHFMQGRYRDAIRFALEGVERSRLGGSSPQVHCLAWSAMARYRLGDWAGFLTDLLRMEDLLGDRRKRPPHYGARPFAAAAIVHEVQGNRAAADAYIAIIAELERSGPPSGTPWTAVVLARRGQAEEALRRLRRADNAAGHRTFRGLLLEARCEVLIEARMWGDAHGAANDARAHGYEAKLLALPLAADRIEGMAALAEERWDDAVRLLGKASAGYSGLEARFDEARTDLALAQALAATGHADEALERAYRASATFETLAAIRERRQASELIERLT